MAITYIFGGIQLIATIVNLLALGAFWVTPGLRTTANKFVINLLFINIFGCLVLSPAIWMNSEFGIKLNQNINANRPVPFIANSLDNNNILNNTDSLFTSVNVVNVSMSNGTNNRYNETNMRIDCAHKHNKTKQFNHNNKSNVIHDHADKKFLENNRRSSSHPISEIDRNSVRYLLNDCKHFWGLDLAAALGGISVLLVVGDTWCAVTDPLRYHTRVSALKSWILIGSNWFIGILFGIGSIFRHDDCHQENTIHHIIKNATVNNHELCAQALYQHNENTYNDSNQSTMFNIFSHTLNLFQSYSMLYAWLFFIVIVLLPICIICIMYWNIFWEARQNGQRMRQNGSSPLLQSALNLATAPAQLSSINRMEIRNNEKDELFSMDPNSARRHTVDTANLRNNISEFNSNSMADKGQKNYSQYLDIPKSNVCISKHQDNLLNNNNNNTSNNNNNNNNNHSNNNSEHNDNRKINSNSNSNSNSNNKNNPVDSEMQLNKTNKKCYPHCDSHRFCKFHLCLQDRACAKLISNASKHSIRSIQSSPNLQKCTTDESDGKITHSQDPISNNGRSSNTFSVSTPPSQSPSTKAISYMSSLRHRLSNASSIFKYREESRAARISILVIIIYLISYFPYGILSLLHGHMYVIRKITIFQIVFLLIANISFPVIFAHRNKRVQRGVCRLFGIDTRKNKRSRIRNYNYHLKETNQRINDLDRCENSILINDTEKCLKPIPDANLDVKIVMERN